MSSATGAEAYLLEGFQITYSVADQDFSRTKSLGILNVSLYLLEQLARQPEVRRLSVFSNNSIANRIPTRRPISVHVCDEAVAGKIRRILWDQWGVYQRARRTGNEWLFLPKGFASFMRRCPVKLATYVHDAVPNYYAEHHPRGFSPTELWYFQKSLRATIKHSDLILTNSDFTTSEISRLARSYRTPQAPVVRAGIGFLLSPAPSTPKRPRILVLASPWPHKRTDLALDYLSRWQTQREFNGQVDWVGRFPKASIVPDFANWRIHSRLAESEYRTLVNEAKALVYFSEYEGFGMPAVEAVLAGTCPVYSDIPALREVMLGTGFTFKNDNYDSFSHALAKALSISADRLEGWAGLLLQRHNWDAVARRLIESLVASNLRAGDSLTKSHL